MRFSRGIFWSSVVVALALCVAVPLRAQLGQGVPVTVCVHDAAVSGLQVIVESARGWVGLAVTDASGCATVTGVPVRQRADVTVVAGAGPVTQQVWIAQATTVVFVFALSPAPQPWGRR